MSATKYLSKEGLSYFWTKVKSHVSETVSTMETVAYNSSTKKITATNKAGTTRDIVNLTQLKTDLGLNNVNNTTDANKPISTAVQAALDTKYSKSEVDTQISKLDGRIDTLIGPGTTKAIDTLKEIESFLAGIEDTNLQTLLDGITTNVQNAGYLTDSDLEAVTTAEIDTIVASQSGSGSGGTGGDSGNTGNA